MDCDYFTRPESEEKINEGDDGTQLSENSIGEKEDVNVREKIPSAWRATKVTKKQKLVVSILLCHIALQFFLPYSHFISKVPSSLTLFLAYFTVRQRYLINLFKDNLK